MLDLLLLSDPDNDFYNTTKFLHNIFVQIYQKHSHCPVSFVELKDNHSSCPPFPFSVMYKRLFHSNMYND